MGTYCRTDTNQTSNLNLQSDDRTMNKKQANSEIFWAIRVIENYNSCLRTFYKGLDDKNVPLVEKGSCLSQRDPETGLLFRPCITCPYHVETRDLYAAQKIILQIAKAES